MLIGWLCGHVGAKNVTFRATVSVRLILTKDIAAAYIQIAKIDLLFSEISCIRDKIRDFIKYIFLKI